MNLETKLAKSNVYSAWKRVGICHHHGIDLPLSALHSKDSCGIGEFFDLFPMIDWCKSVGMDVIQLLPLNDTDDDTSPFFAISSMALNPIFLSLHKLPGVHEKELSSFKQFNEYPRVHFHEVQTHKLLFLREYFKKKGADIVKEKAFEEYVFQNEWVENYALFKVLKDIMSKYHWQTWPSDLQFLDEKRRDELISTNWVEVCFYVFLQYLCYKQLKEVRAYANERGVFLKGDIPILLSPDSADVWEYTDEFDLTLSAGAPPDRFTPNGQFWGLPIFRWNVMESRDFDWWKNRLDYAANFYDIYRIDHIIGFFRIWAIPHGQPARVGKFIPDDQSHWLEHGKNILTTLVARSPMLPIGEDLGVVPDTVRACLSSLGICGTKVIRWEEKHEPKDYDPISMTTVSTHDSETLLQWWQEDHKEPLSKEKRKELLETCHNSASLFHINLIGEYLALFPELVWENPQDERINVPGTVSPNNWTYRIRPSVEEILAHKPLAEEVKSLLC